MNILNKVVFIDDDNYTNEYHKRFVARIGLAKEVIFFESGEEALKYLSNIDEKYDFPELILADINMPKMDGHEFISKVTNMHAYNPMRTIVAFLTASKASEDMLKANEQDVEYYYWKPLDEKLLATILSDGFGIKLN